MRAAFPLIPLVLVATAARAQTPPASPTSPPPLSPAVHAVRVNEPITVDGALNEPIWRSVEPIGIPTQSDPRRGTPASQRTEVRVVYDDAALYVGARMFDTHPDSIVAHLARRDNTAGSDRVTIYLDTFHDRRNGYYFGITAAGTLYDGTLMNDDWDDDSWDGVWLGRARRDSLGWTAEMRIPFSQLRSTGGEHPVWGVNFGRVIGRVNETDRYAYAPLGESGYVSRFPDMSGLDGIHTSHVVEVSPYSTGKAEYLVHDRADPFASASKYTPAAGGDLRTNVGSKLTLNATINPDFGQVEIDPAVVNLSDVETFFNEKRPFFTEGLSVFRCGNNGASDYWGFNWPEPVYFYTRRIGRAPEGGTPDHTAYADVPVATRILGAVKLTGQPAPHWNFGTLHALTEKETADYQLDDGSRGNAVVEPLTYYGVLRGLRSFNDERQGLGLMALETARSLDGTGLADQLNRNGLVTAMDGWTFLDSKKVWVISGHASATRVDGTRARIAALKQDSQHYYQRPDRGDLGVDSTATSLDGYTARLWLNRQTGPWMSNSAIGVMSPGFENNDLGFTWRTDVINSHAGLGYDWNKPTSWKKDIWVLGAVAEMWNFAGQHTMSQIYAASRWTLLNSSQLRLDCNLLDRVLDDRATRGGPAMESPSAISSSLNWNSTDAGRISTSASASASGNVRGYREYYASPSVTWKPSSNMSFSVGPSVDWNHEDAHYITTASDPLATGTYGHRYVFAELAQTTVGAQMRMDCSLTPALSIQLYVQPLVSSGRYSQYKELSRPDGYDFLTYGTDGSTLDLTNGLADPDGGGPAPAVDIGHPDFTFRTVRGNAVVRWEYVPGSTIYLVWTQDRTGTTDNGNFDLRPSLSALGRTPANNIVLVKVSHHFEL